MLKNFKKGIIVMVLSATLLIPVTANAASTTYTVVTGDTVAKIATKTQTAVKELIEVNPKIAKQSSIYPGLKIIVPEQEGLAFEEEVFRLVNEERANAGLVQLQYDFDLANVAEDKSEDISMNKYFSHKSPTYGSPFDMMKAYGIKYKSAAENLAKGQKTPQEVVQAWMKSPGHKANILNASYTHIGVGYVEEGKIWTQLFIKK